MKSICQNISKELKKLLYNVKYNAKNCYVVAITFLIIMVICVVPSIFALPQPIKSVEIFSENLSFQNKEPGAWKVTKSAYFTGSDTAKISIDVKTTAKERIKKSDIILVMDISVSMSGYKLEKARSDALELIDNVLADGDNKVALISFDSTASIKRNFTNNKDELKNSINALRFNNQANYYQALKSVGEILENYKVSDDRGCTVLFLTGSYPSVETPNEVGYFNYLKTTYPYITINAIQYGMGEEVVDEVRRISDYQYVINSADEENILLVAASLTEEYESFEIDEFYESEYFYVESISSIDTSQGIIEFDKASQHINWKVNNLKTGSNIKMIINASLKSSYIKEVGFYKTNKSITIKSKIGENIEEVTSSKTPVLSNNYKVTYDSNVAGSCKVENIPDEENYFIFDEVLISDKVPTCEGYEFKRWKVIGTEARQVSDDYFIMPESDVVVRAEWSKASLIKRMHGKVYVVHTPKMQVAENADSGGNKFWAYRDSITKVVFQDLISDLYNVEKSWDVSAEGNNGVMARLVPNYDEAETYTLYIQGDNGVIANEDSSYLFNQFRRLESIEGLEYLDTTNVTNMSYMFGWCEKLKSLDLRSFDTSKVTTMVNMFRDNLVLESLDVSSFDTTNVSNMQWMFGGTAKLQSLNLKNFNTSKVTDMLAMFAGTGIINLDLSSFDTRNVTTMRVMFSNANFMETLIVSNFNTEKVTNTSNMFNNCYALKALDLSSFVTPKVTSMEAMFNGCNNLETLDVSNFNTLNVTTMKNMFKACNKLKTLDLSSFVTSKVKNMEATFMDCNELEALNVSNFNTLNVTTMKNMFNACNKLKTLDLSSFVTSKVTTMLNLFKDCYDLVNLDLSNFNTSIVTDMGAMFASCRTLENIDVSNFNTQNVTNMNSMFYECYVITSLDVEKFNTSKVKNMGWMFAYCKKLKKIDVTKFDTSNVTIMDWMFGWCLELTELNVSNFKTSNVTSMKATFFLCQSLTSLNVTNFDTSKVTNMSNMFDELKKIQTLDLSNFNTSKVTNMNWMFYGCYSLTSLNLENFDTSLVKEMQGMFDGCWRLTTLNLSNLKIVNATRINQLFKACTNLSANVTIYSTIITDFTEVFGNNAASGSNAKIIVNYTSSTSSLVDQMIASKTANSNVIKGSLVV